MKNSRSPLFVFCAISLLAGVKSLSAESTTGTLTVTAAVATNCTVNNVSIDLGTITTNIENDTTGNLSVSCTNGLPYIIALGSGLNLSYGPSGDGVRAMASGTNRLVYNIYQNSTHTLVWGGTEVPLSAPKGILTGTGALQSFPFYIQVPAQTAPPSGTYTDTVTISAIF